MRNISAKNISLSIDQLDQEAIAAKRHRLLDQREHALVAGSTVTGMVRVSRGTNMEKANLLFIGKEDVCVIYEVSVSEGEHTRKEQRFAESQRDIVRMMIPLDIRYKVKLKLNKHEVDNDIPVVAQPPSSQPVPNLVEPVSTNIRLCCCIPKGKIIVAANVDDTRVGEGEEIKVDLGIKNNSTAELEYVQAFITQKVAWHSGIHREKERNFLASSDFNLDHDNMRARSKNEMQEMKNTATMVGNADRSRGLDLSDDTFRELLAAVKDGSNKVILKIPDSKFENHDGKYVRALNTYDGKYVTVKHHLSIRVKTPFGSTNPTIKVPLQIVSPDSVGDPSHSHQEPAMPPNPVAPPHPEGWNADNVTSVVPSAPSLHNTISYGGDVVDSKQEVAFDLPPTGGGSPTYDYPSLLKEIQSSLSIRTKLQDLLKDNEWKAVIIALMPEQFLEILDKVSLDFDKADVIEILAGVVQNFNCAYAVMILRKIPDWLRIQTVQKMIPFCTDLKTNKSVLINELSDWERISTERDFENEISKQNNQWEE